MTKLTEDEIHDLLVRLNSYARDADRPNLGLPMSPGHVKNMVEIVLGWYSKTEVGRPSLEDELRAVLPETYFQFFLHQDDDLLKFVYQNHDITVSRCEDKYKIEICHPSTDQVIYQARFTKVYAEKAIDRAFFYCEAHAAGLGIENEPLLERPE